MAVTSMTADARAKRSRETRGRTMQEEDEGEEGQGEEEEEERVVYYDLDERSRGRGKLALLDASQDSVSADQPTPLESRLEASRRGGRAPATTTGPRIRAQPLELFTQQTQFRLHAPPAEEATAVSPATSSLRHRPEDDDDEDDEEDANPFASLLGAAPREITEAQGCADHQDAYSPRQSPSPRASATAIARRSQVVSRTSLSPSPPSQLRRQELIARTRQPLGVANKRVAATSRPLGAAFEAADARPARWTRGAGASRSSDAKRRRQSLTATRISRAEAQEEAAAAAKRRRSLPTRFQPLQPQQQSDALAGRRRLSEVLQRATRLSQQPAPATADSSMLVGTSGQMNDVSMNHDVVDDDGIVDTAHAMREEHFETQFFSPVKATGTAASSRGGHHRKPKPDAVLLKIRGALGDAIRRASRKTKRELTALRSQGHTLLLGQGDDHDSATAIHGRDAVVLRLSRVLRVDAVHQTLECDAVVREVVARKATQGKNDSSNNSNAAVKLDKGDRVVALFTAQSAASPRALHMGMVVKVFAPFQVIPPTTLPGGRRGHKSHRSRPFLVGTSLHEIVELP